MFVKGKRSRFRVIIWDLSRVNFAISAVQKYKREKFAWQLFQATKLDEYFTAQQPLDKIPRWNGVK